MRRRAIIGKSKNTTDTRPEGPGGFKMQIQTTTANEVFTLPTRSGYTYNATVLWGDGTSSQVTGHNVNNVKTYATAGTYDIEIKGQFDSIYFNNTGSKLLVKKILSWGGSDFQGFTTMNNAFYGCTNLNELAIGGIKERSGSQITSFSGTFNGCTSLTSIPIDLFRYNIAVTTFYNTFNGCSKLTTIPTDLFRYNTAVTDFGSTFNGCTSLTSLPIDLFSYNAAVTSLGYAFQSCTSLTTLPTDLFRYNIAINNFVNTFNGCSALTTLPNNLFQYNTAATSFLGTFYNCYKLKLSDNIFGATPDFGTRVMNFNSCFSRSTFTGTQGTAPALWSATMNASSTKDACFGGAGNSATSLTNYANIPAEWK